MSTIAVPVSSATSSPTRIAPRTRWQMWFPVSILVLYWAAVLFTNLVEVSTFTKFVTQAGGGFLLMIGFVIWWLIHWRFSFVLRIAGLAVAILAIVQASYLVHPSIVVPFGLLIMGVAPAVTAWIAWLFMSWYAADRTRFLGVLAVVILAWVPELMLRMHGLKGNVDPVLSWRWTPSPEELFLAERAQHAPTASAVVQTGPVKEEPGDWPAFRGPNRNGIVKGTHITTDWSAHPPKALWRQRAGAGWSSLCVVGGRVFTQEQRGEVEVVVCLDAATGKEIWVHSDTARFWDGQSGAGPRATPTFADGKLVTFGGKGNLDCLDAASGKLLWTRNVAADTGAPDPVWGFSASPLIVNDLAIVFAGAQPKEEGKGLVAYKLDKGDLAWSIPAGHHSYVSAQFATLGGVPQVLSFSDEGLLSVDPKTGKTLWTLSEPSPAVWRALQPHPISDTQVLISTEVSNGLELLNVTRSGDSWEAKPAWRSSRLKGAYNDFAIFNEHLYGFDNGIFCCLDMKNGERVWKDGHYGHGQMLLLADQALILVLSEQGEAILVSATPEKFNEVARFQALEGKTWNHPVIAHGKLFVRNAEEIACYEVEAGAK